MNCENLILNCEKTAREREREREGRVSNWTGLSWLQTPREDRAASSPGNQNNHTPTPSPSPVGDAPVGRALMEAALQQATSGSQPPLVVTPPGYWVDGTDHRHALDSAGRALLPAQPAWQPRIDQDDTAKCYRRFFVGRVTYIYISLL